MLYVFTVKTSVHMFPQPPVQKVYQMQTKYDNFCNSPGVAGAVLQTPLLLINKFMSPQSFCSNIFETPSHITCHMSHITCIFFIFFLDKVLKLVGEVLVINAAFHV